MIFDQAIAQSCGFCLQGGVQVFSAEGLERRFESGVQQIVISDSVASASLLNQLSMQHENLLFTQSFHLASTSYAYSARTAHPFQRNGAPFRFKLSKAQQVD